MAQLAIDPLFLHGPLHPIEIGTETIETGTGIIYRAGHTTTMRITIPEIDIACRLVQVRGSVGGDRGGVREDGDTLWHVNGCQDLALVSTPV